MKTLKILLLTIILTGMNLSFAQTARLQVIHNAADPGAVAVDIGADRGGAGADQIDVCPSVFGSLELVGGRVEVDSALAGTRQASVDSSFTGERETGRSDEELDAHY